MPLPVAVLDAIEVATSTRPQAKVQPISGGCIHQAFRWGDFFIKANHASKAPVFSAEKIGLETLAATKTIRVPATICSGHCEDISFLALEFLPLVGNSLPSQEQLGIQLATLHGHTNELHGFSSDNFIGETPQTNTYASDGVTFLHQSRLGALASLLAKRGEAFEELPRLLDSLDLFFEDYTPVPSLLHGDLWNGNANALADDTPVLFDPAVFYGDRESDLAMTELFGGFSDRFYEAYHEAWPLDPGYQRRKGLYQLYHLMNHALLFGGSYRTQVRTTISHLLKPL